MNPQSAIRNPQSSIRVLLVDDSPLALTILKRMLASSPDIQVVGTAGNGKEALELIPRLQPAVICTDLHMQEMDGFELTRRIMAEYPRPILVVSASVQKEDTHNVFRLLEAGAIEVFPKPAGGLGSDYQQLTQEFISKIRILSGVVVFRKQEKKLLVSSPPRSLYPQVETARSASIIAIGASTGGPQALQTILTQLPSGFPLPLVCVQHIGDGFLSGLVDWLALQSRLRVKIAQPGELPLPGTIYFPQEGTHLVISQDGKLVSSHEPPFEGHRPSVTLTLRSVADYYGSAAVGVLLTGMGRDGAEGLQAMAKAGALTIAQDEESCVVFGMPKQAIELGAARYVLPLSEIARLLASEIWAKKRIGL